MNSLAHKPVDTLAQLATLDAAEIMRGYWAGYDNEEIIAETCTRSFWHGWRVGRVDAGHVEPDRAQIALIVEMAELRRSGMH